jgi:heat shock protein HspQ
MDAEEVRRWIHDNKDTLPHNIRLEKDVPWVHIDVIDTGRKIYYF